MTISAVAILGSTGTIGVNTLDVIARHPDRFRVYALAANNNHEKILEQCRQFSPDYAVMVEPDAAQRLHNALSREEAVSTQVLSGVSGLEQVVTDTSCDIVMAAIVGAAGLNPTLAAARAGKKILLANKESLVMSGQLFMQTVHDHGALLLPVDSEHNAIWQCLPEAILTNRHLSEQDLIKSGVESILLTASGGPFRNTPVEGLDNVTPDQACAHPNWRMGRKISVDSATMMNKGLEFIEAHWLFGLNVDQINIVIHPESVVHSMVTYCDGTVLAQLSNPDMRTPIAYALSWPDRIAAGVEPLDIFEVASLSFEKPNHERFPSLILAYDAVKNGGTCSAILNAANEVAVASFLERKIRFSDIAVIVEKVLEQVSSHSADSLDNILADDHRAREAATEFINICH